MCQFYEEYKGAYLRYRSVVDETRFIGFNKVGKPMKNLHGRQECFNFIKFNPHADITHHNSLLNAEVGSMEPRERGGTEPISRKPPSRRSTKAPHRANSLLQANSARQPVRTSTSARTSTHHHRHSNQLQRKMPQDKTDTKFRRVVHGRPLIEASKN